MAGKQREEWRGKYVTLCSYCLMAEQIEKRMVSYNVTLYSYCLMSGEQREEWRAKYNVTLYSYCLMAGEHGD